MALRAKDIAEMLGVSTATVSLVLNNKPGVGEKRRQEIIQKIKEMDCGYMLKEQRINNGSIGFVVYKREGSIVDESPFFTYILEGINNRINHYGYTLNFLYINKTMPRTEQEHQIKSGGYSTPPFARSSFCSFWRMPQSLSVACVGPARKLSSPA